MNWRLKSGYRENLTRQTWEADRPGSYWYGERLALSSDYQLDVYLRARDLAAAAGARAVLDVGSGPGLKAARVLSEVIPDIVLIDQPTTTPLAAAKCPTATFVGANLEEATLDLRRTFDLIICADVIEHLLDPGPCLELIRRHASAETWIVLSTPERDYARGLDCMACDKPEHVREWTGFEFVEMLRDRGFDVVAHHVCPTLRPEHERGDLSLRCLEPFTPRPSGPGADEPDRARSCQVCECRIRSSAVAG